jgi:hypothetical protein
MNNRRKWRDSGLIVAAVALLVALGMLVGNTANAAGPSPDPKLTVETRTCTTNASGICTVSHSLGEMPEAVLAQLKSPSGGQASLPYDAATSWTATDVTLRFLNTQGAAYVGSVTFSLLVGGPNSGLPTASPTVTTSPPVGSVNPSGEPPATPAGTHEIFYDDFGYATQADDDGRLFDSGVQKWWGYEKGTPTTGNGGSPPCGPAGIYDPGTAVPNGGGVHVVSTDGQFMNVRGFADAPNGCDSKRHTHTAAQVPNIADWKFGEAWMRVKADLSPGYATATLMWPGSDVWNDGEIDWAEDNHDGADGPWRAFNHCPGAHPENNCASGTGPADMTTFHTVHLKWDATHVTVDWDGVQIMDDVGHSPQVVMHAVLQDEGCSDGFCPSATGAGATWTYDWMKIVQPN